jgi:hypothetical protein
MWRLALTRPSLLKGRAIDVLRWQHSVPRALVTGNVDGASATPLQFHSVRHFSRRPKDHLDDPTEEFLEEHESKTLKENEGSVAALDMEFFGDQEMMAASSGFNDDGYDDDDDDEEERAAKLNEEYRQKQEEIQRELDSRTGRPWQDPWAIKEEQWMSNATYDDLPDWTPEQVSRISQERVQVHPGEKYCAAVMYVFVSSLFCAGDSNVPFSFFL